MDSCRDCRVPGRGWRGRGTLQQESFRQKAAPNGSAMQRSPTHSTPKRLGVCPGRTPRRKLTSRRLVAGLPNKIDADGAAISAYANEAKTELPSSTELSAARRGAATRREVHCHKPPLRSRAPAELVLGNHIARRGDGSCCCRGCRQSRSNGDLRNLGTSFPQSSSLSRLKQGFDAPHQAVPTGGLIPCDQNISVDSVTSCPFADNVFRAYVRSYRFNGKQANIQVEAFSPVTHRPYSMDCFLTGRQTVDCTGGRKAFVTFPFRAAANY